MYMRYFRQYGRMRIEIDQATLATEFVVPSSLQMRYFHCVANRLDVTGYLGRLRAENRGDAESEKTAHFQDNKV